ncbi:conserved hypothetical protein [Leishmania major strain Friedlin]|uniref:Cytochrome b5 heme-binding domain-containing protein n=1 Tax=Leishmania major TaxID=5664 RepID=Q4QE55_LEIMA|nr:conserved hypothetical protein [Leishmania major strain Friedlin]CAG9572369.1 Cytochrome_b5-like_Heme/Steroid_binding_domain_containing_protein_-_putative [Leishmania major strain Friedlin]CAJ04079.1 conserved hypothetical protein [Leishmania major strain Friedlin]|eukprot:XP_001682393.1 conserved hypothetical protein [Leishmania major strain Friedlin]
MPEHDWSGGVLAVVVLLVATACGVISGCDVCGVSVAKRVMAPSDRPDGGVPEATAVTSSGSTATATPMLELDDHLRGAATGKADTYVEEFYQAAGHLRCPQPQRHTQEEVARHRTKDDLWIVVDGNVLNVSAFVPHHPGGDVLLDGVGGQDMATVFAYFHDPSTVRLLVSFCIGRLLLQ